MIIRKSEAEIAKMARAGEVVAEVNLAGHAHIRLSRDRRRDGPPDLSFGATDDDSDFGWHAPILRIAAYRATGLVTWSCRDRLN